MLVNSKHISLGVLPQIYSYKNDFISNCLLANPGGGGGTESIFMIFIGIGMGYKRCESISVCECIHEGGSHVSPQINLNYKGCW